MMSSLSDFELNFLKRIETIVAVVPSELSEAAESFWRNSLIDFSNSLIDRVYVVKRLNHESD